MHPGDADMSGTCRAMLWSVEEAVEKQTLQIGASACGATAVVDVLQALDIGVSAHTAELCVRTRLRRTDAPLADYLLSRSEAGATHQQLIEGAQQASRGQVTGRFFALYPPRRVQLMSWLASWIHKGAVPVATMNMQRAVPEGEEMPDAWHHQLVFGVDPDAVYMTNPLDVVSEEVVLQRLCSESVLLIRRDDVLERWTGDGPIGPLFPHVSDLRWTTLDVEGQVKRMCCEKEGQSTMSHITIPAAYQSGMTLFALLDSDTGRELLHTCDLPLLSGDL